MEKKLKITSGKQFQTLVSELESNPILARGFHRGTSPNSFKQNWEEIAMKLNSIGPPIRDSDGWQKVWRDFKFKVKKKLVLQKNDSKNATGGGRFKQLALLPLEEAVAKLIQSQRQSISESVVKDNPSHIKIKTEIPDTDNLEEEDNLQPTITSAFHDQEFATPNRKKRKMRKNDERLELFENVFREISLTMLEVRNLLKESTRYQQKLCEVEEKKLSMMTRRHEREEELFETEMKIKNLKMKIKIKELEDLEVE